VTEKYQPADILQIIRANYIQQQQFDDIVLKGRELSENEKAFNKSQLLNG
jgi:hypothetical protein